MMIQSVRADTGGREGKWVGLIIVFILCFATVAIPFHQAESHVKAVLDHQILVTDVEQENLAMLSELRLAHEEIRDLRMDSDGEWPSVASLKDEWVAPFVEDQSWKRKGAHAWVLDERGYYFSTPSEYSTPSEQATQPDHGSADSFILNANSVSPEIWIFLGGVAKQPATFDQHTLESTGWKMVVNESEIEQHHESDAH
ncbi:conserved hypothetical protein [Vibrio crassostreae]|uniref:DUF6162 family protein n=1 Tax=Vibrio crassostreae TaxID=246167 RepID=UPI001048F286|nr:hypothetical protein [Vibrio crassostreae]TCN91029.1 hypothetical protein EDB37_100335 [Vibrio crassostreae]CAK2446745.1 conserved hypothetical protein [Vibrio crassostreae]CAK2505691.1 conserved hypothetical protein [Vibrio crassostreae]CAK3852416.1 conserved hypothetical protein [Vibrio crassostreae]CAK3891079.1 conserved hypothetical protein [Vibrio crassostreae]